MSFAYPSALFWLALAIPLVLLYILKVRLRRVSISTNMFWQQVYEEKPPRALWQQLRHVSSLLLQLLLLLLIVVAIADPFLTGRVASGRRLVLIMDNSASMAASDVSSSRLEAAKSDAIDLIDSLGPLDEATVLVAGRNPEVACGMTGHLPTLKDAVKSIFQSDGSTSLEPAVKLAQKLLSTDPARQATGSSVSHRDIIVFTDGCLSAEDEAIFLPNLQNESSSHVSPTTRLFGKSVSNVGITRFQARRALSDPTGYEVLVSVQNASDEAVRCRLELTLNDALIDVLPLQLSPGEIWSQSIPKTASDGGVLAAELSAFRKPLVSQQSGSDSEPNNEDSGEQINDGLAADNRSFALLTPRPAVPVLLVTAGNIFLQKVLEATPRVELSMVSSMPKELPEGFAQRNGVIIIHGAVPTPLPSGNVMVIDPANDTEFWKLQDPVESPLMTDLDESSSLLTFVKLQNVSLPKVVPLQFVNEFRPVVRTISGDVLMASLQRSSGRCLVLSMNLNESDLGFRTAFPILVSNAMTWFAGSASDIELSLKPDETFSLSVPANVVGDSRMLTLTGPNAVVRSVPIRRGEDAVSDGSAGSTAIQLGPFPSVGLWSLKSPLTDSQSLSIPVNLSDLRESDLRPVKSLADRTSSARSLPSTGFSRPIWMTLITLACVLTCVEWLVYHRRVIE